MGRWSVDSALKKRIREGEIRKQDVVRRLAELAFSDVGDCVKLVLDETSDLNKLDLGLLRELKFSGNGAVEIKLIDRLEVLEQLAQMTGEDSGALCALLEELKTEAAQ